MGLIRTTIEIFNADDQGVAARGYIPSSEIRQVKVIAGVDSGAYMSCINETIANQLGLRILDEQEAQLADGTFQTFKIAGPVEIRFGNRRTHQDAMVLPGNAEVLLGAIPMEDMDVVIDPLAQKLIPHPDRPYLAGKYLKGLRR